MGRPKRKPNIKINSGGDLPTLSKETRPPIVSSKIKNLVGLEGKVQIPEPNIKIGSEDDFSEECSNNTQSRNTTSDVKIVSINIIIGNKSDRE